MAGQQGPAPSFHLLPLLPSERRGAGGQSQLEADERHAVVLAVLVEPVAQHQAGRHVTEAILRLAPTSRADGDDRRRLVGAMQTFIAMYRPHAAREDTDLFPKLRRLVSSNEYDAMAEEFEKEEHKLFGEDGFDKMADRVAQMEQRIGIHDLNQFTPH